MRLELPRELLWAIIAGLAITVVVLWPSKYPYSQAPQVHSEQQTNDGIGRQGSAGHSPTPQINAGGDQNDQHRGENASETSILGIKPGEWLIGIVTWMLWLATVRLVRSAENTAERQLRAYVLPEGVSAQVMRVGQVPRIRVKLRNSGQTPAYQVMNTFRAGFQRPGDPDTVIDWNRGGPYSRGNIAPNTTVRAFGGTNTLRPLAQETIDGVSAGSFVFYVVGEVRYLDAFGKSRTSRYRYIFNQNTGLREGRLWTSPHGNDAT